MKGKGISLLSLLQFEFFWVYPCLSQASWRLLGSRTSGMMSHQAVSSRSGSLMIQREIKHLAIESLSTRCRTRWESVVLCLPPLEYPFLSFWRNSLLFPFQGLWAPAVVQISNQALCVFLLNNGLFLFRTKVFPGIGFFIPMESVGLPDTFRAFWFILSHTYAHIKRTFCFHFCSCFRMFLERYVPLGR